MEDLTEMATERPDPAPDAAQALARDGAAGRSAPEKPRPPSFRVGENWLPMTRGLAYFSVPKVACTSIKMMMYELETGVPARDDIAAGRMGVIHDAVKSLPYGQYVKRDLDGHATFAVVRDPVSRIESCYRDKVLGEKMMHLLLDREAFERLGLEERPSFADFVARLEDYRAASGLIRHHSQPLPMFLGLKPAFFDALFGMHRLGELADWVSERVGGPVEIGHANRTERPAEGLAGPRERDEIERLYARDAVYSDWFA